MPYVGVATRKENATHAHILIPICTYMKAALPFAVASHIFVLCFFGVKNLWFKDTKIKFN